MKKAFSLILILAIGGTLSAQTFERASSIAESDLKKSLVELSTLRKRVEVERIPLAKELSKLETSALEKRKEADRISRMRDNREVDLNTMQDRIKQLGNNNSYVSGLLGDYIRRFETQIHIGEQQIYQSKIDAARLAVEDVNLSDDERFKIQLDGLKTAFGRLEKVIGGHIFTGKAVLPGGSYEDGKFAIVGPIAYFSANNNGLSGLAELEINSSNAVVKDIGEDFYEGIAKLTATKTAAVPVDATLGDALQLKLTEETIVQHIKKGGVVMYPILGLASFAFLVAIFKWFEISGVRRARSEDIAVILSDLKAGDKDKAMEKANAVKGPVGEMLKAAVEYSDKDLELLEEVLYEKIITTQPTLERMLPLIAVTAATAPLLGLLGTVTGMIKTFKLITVFGTGDASNLATGISEALITTEFGLIIAIPSLILHAILSRKAKGVISSMEQAAVGFLNGLTEFRNDQSA